MGGDCVHGLSRRFGMLLKRAGEHDSLHWCGGMRGGFFWFSGEWGIGAADFHCSGWGEGVR